MSELVSSFLDVQLGKQKYLFFLITWNDYVTSLSKTLDDQWEAFGADLGPNGTVIKAYERYAKDNFENVMAKAWPPDIQNRFYSEQDPFIVVIDRDFAAFNPTEHPWAIIWMSEFFKEPGTIYRLFGSMARRVERGQDLFEYLQSVARKQKIEKVNSYFELKPKIFGVSVDIKGDVAGLGERVTI